jgi:hypothetical protein
MEAFPANFVATKIHTDVTLNRLKKIENDMKSLRKKVVESFNGKTAYHTEITHTIAPDLSEEEQRNYYKMVKEELESRGFTVRGKIAANTVTMVVFTNAPRTNEIDRVLRAYSNEKEDNTGGEDAEISSLQSPKSQSTSSTPKSPTPSTPQQPSCKSPTPPTQQPSCKSPNPLTSSTTSSTSNANVPKQRPTSPPVLVRRSSTTVVLTDPPAAKITTTPVTTPVTTSSTVPVTTSNTASLITSPATSTPPAPNSNTNEINMDFIKERLSTVVKK